MSDRPENDLSVLSEAPVHGEVSEDIARQCWEHAGATTKNAGLSAMIGAAAGRMLSAGALTEATYGTFVFLGEGVALAAPPVVVAALGGFAAGEAIHALHTNAQYVSCLHSHEN